MQTIHNAIDAPDLPNGCVVTIGNYDGVHAGQREVLAQVVERAKAEDLFSVVVTFDPHPLKVLKGDAAPLALTTARQKGKLLAESGVDFVLFVKFDAEFSRMSAESFARDFLAKRLEAKHVMVGSDFSFGKDREGDFAQLAAFGQELGFCAEAVDEVRSQGNRVSSTLIRGLLAGGAVERANELLGRAYSITGTIVQGDRMGQKIGWPTINLDAANELIPATGVYASRVQFPSFPTVFDGVTNIGTRPTVYENYQQVVETHILEFRSDVYGEQVELSFFRRLRDEMLFHSTMDLSAQISRDVDSARDYFRTLSDPLSDPLADPLVGAPEDSVVE